MKKISIVTPCYNEEDNVEKLYQLVKEQFFKLQNYEYEHIFIDNGSTDRTVDILKQLASVDHNVKIIVNSRNFGFIRSQYYGLLQGSGDATILMVADLQDPPELIPEFIAAWEQGNELVVGVKNKSSENKLLFFIRKQYYYWVSKLSSTNLIQNFYGFGLYDKKIVDVLRKLRDPYPYLRGLVMEIGFNVHIIYYHQPVREKGKSKFNFFSLYDVAMLGICSQSKVPLRVATILGFALSFLSFLVALIYLILKLCNWSSFPVGTASILIALFFFSSVQLFFIGIVGEYIQHIVTKQSDFPLVIERERINFD